MSFAMFYLTFRDVKIFVPDGENTSFSFKIKDGYPSYNVSTMLKINDTDYIAPGGIYLGTEFDVGKLKITKIFTNDVTTFPIITFQVHNTDEYNAKIGLSHLITYEREDRRLERYGKYRDVIVYGYDVHNFVLGDDLLITNVDAIFINEFSMCQNPPFPFLRMVMLLLLDLVVSVFLGSTGLFQSIL